MNASSLVAVAAPRKRTFALHDRNLSEGVPHTNYAGMGAVSSRAAGAASQEQIRSSSTGVICGPAVLHVQRIARVRPREWRPPN
jgi:hypothetical protein